MNEILNNCNLDVTDNELKIYVRQLTREVKDLMTDTNATLLLHDHKIAELCLYIKDNLSNSLRCLLDGMLASGELDQIIESVLTDEIRLLKDVLFTPEEFGCFGDGKHDDTNALQNAFNSGYQILCKGVYLVSKTIEIKNNIIMYGDSYIKASNKLTDPTVKIMSKNQTIGRNISINVDGSGVSSPTIAICKPKRCYLDLEVINAGNIGIDCNNMSYAGNNENTYKFSVTGNKLGTTEIGVLVNCYDSTFESIITKDCLKGVEIDHGELIANEIHCWLSNELAPKLWTNSYAIYDKSYYRMCVNWLYQDSVRYGIGGTAPNGSVRYFEYFNNLTNKDTLYNNEKNVYVTAGSTRLTIDRFVNSLNENKPLSYELANVPTNEFGVVIKNGVSTNPDSIKNYLPFNDLNKAPQIGCFYIPYNTSNNPTSVNGYLELKVVGSCCVQTFYPSTFNDLGRYYMRLKPLNTGTFTEWKVFNANE